MKARGRLVCLLCAAVASAALALPVTAAAKPRYIVFGPGFHLHAKLGTSNGYAVSVDGIGHRQVLVTVKRFGQSATYRVAGRVSRDGLNADLGRYGGLRARFDGTATKRPFFLEGCRGRKSIKAHGTLGGVLRFRGEDGYVRISPHRVKASYEKSFRQVCKNGSGESDRPLAGSDPFGADVLEARSRSGGRSLLLRAIELDPGVSLLTAAIAKERVGRITIERVTESRGKDESVDFSPAGSYPRTVTVAPSAPLLGAATYTEQEDGSSEWAGDLRAPLAGLGVVPLTGPGFHVEVCRGSLLKVIDRCPT